MKNSLNKKMSSKLESSIVEILEMLEKFPESDIEIMLRELGVTPKELFNLIKQLEENPYFEAEESVFASLYNDIEEKYFPNSFKDNSLVFYAFKIDEKVEFVTTHVGTNLYEIDEIEKEYLSNNIDKETLVNIISSDSGVPEDLVIDTIDSFIKWLKLNYSLDSFSFSADTFGDFVFKQIESSGLHKFWKVDFFPSVEIRV